MSEKEIEKKVVGKILLSEKKLSEKNFSLKKIFCLKNNFLGKKIKNPKEILDKIKNQDKSKTKYKILDKIKTVRIFFFCKKKIFVGKNIWLEKIH